MNALCRADSNHRARCYCPSDYKGDPTIQCIRPECVNDHECPFNLACVNERCGDPCNCGLGAICNVNNHRAACSCPPSYTGDPNSECKIVIQEIPVQCKMDADCASKLACFGGVCKNPCVETKPCGRNAECSVVDTLPLRTMSCLCLPGYVGDADVECKLGKNQMITRRHIKIVLFQIINTEIITSYFNHMCFLFQIITTLFCFHTCNLITHKTATHY